MAVALNVQLLGGFSLRLSGTPLSPQSISRRKVRSLLKLLAVTPNHRLSRDQVLDKLWPELEATAAAAQLYNALYSLRKTLAEAAPQLQQGLVVLEPPGGLWVDAEAFRLQAEQALSSLQTQHLEQAITLFSGIPLPEDLYEDWAEEPRETLQSLFLRCLQALAEQSNGVRAEQLWLEVLKLDPTSESAYQALLKLSAQRPSELERYYQSYLEAMQQELGAEPNPTITQLYESLRQAPSPLPTALPASNDTPSPLPAPSAALIGRQAELRAILAFLQNPQDRLLSLVGPGGNGKTRLALEVAWQQQLHGAVSWMACETLDPHKALAPRLAENLGLRGVADDQALNVLQDYLRSKSWLLVFDNLEHLPQAPELIAALLQAAPQLKVLATSRSRLGLEGEQVLEVGGISPAAAAELFVQSAQRVQRSFNPNQAEQQQLLQLGEYLAGSPLAVNLAAAWVRMMGLNEIVQEIAQDPDFLANPSASSSRHASLRAVFESSWRLLSPPEQDTLLAVGVFRGPFSMAAAKAVSGAARMALMALVDRSLLQSDQGWLELHPLLRVFVLEKAQLNLERWQALQQAHAVYYLEQAQSIAARLQAPSLQSYSEARSQATPLITNLGEAWLNQAKRGQTAWLESALPSYYDLYQYSDQLPAFLGLLNTAMEVYSSPRMQLFRGVTRVTLGRLGEGQADLESLQATHLSPAEQGVWLRHRSFMHLQLDQHAQAIATAQEAVDLARSLGDGAALANALSELGAALADRQLYAEAEAAYLEAQHQVGLHPRRQVYNLSSLVILAGQRGDYHYAEQGLRQVIQSLEQLDDRRNLQMARNNLSVALLVQGHYAQAFQELQTATEAARQLGDLRALSSLLANQLTALAALGQADLAPAILDEMYRVNQQGTHQPWLATCLVRQGHLYLGLGEWMRASQSYQQSLQVSQVAPNIHAEARLGLAQVAMWQRQWPETQRWLEQVQPQHRFAPVAWACKARLAWAQDKPLEALEHLRSLWPLLAKGAFPFLAEALAYVLPVLAQQQPQAAQTLGQALLADPRSSALARRSTLAFDSALVPGGHLETAWQQVQLS